MGTESPVYLTLFVVDVGALESGIGAILYQGVGNPPRLHPCCLYTRKRTDTEHNYDIRNKELFVMKAAFEVETLVKGGPALISGSNRPYEPKIISVRPNR